MGRVMGYLLMASGETRRQGDRDGVTLLGDPMSHQSTPTVLLAEDSVAIRSILAFLLRGRGYVVIECADGQEALDRVRAEPPDAIILDVMMPGPTGFDVCQSLKSDPATRAIPIMILTSVTQGTGKSDDHWKALAGADDFMTKPFKAADILQRLARLLAPRPDGPRPAADPSPRPGRLDRSING